MAYVNVSLEDLVGEHVLTGADHSAEQVRLWSSQFEDCYVLNFVLDGMTITVVENPEDGYRSSLGDVRVSSIPRISNTFPPVKVICEMSDDPDEDILNIIDAKTGKVIISVGTEFHDNYYPMFIASFDPRNMAINQE